METKYQYEITLYVSLYHESELDNMKSGFGASQHKVQLMKTDVSRYFGGMSVDEINNISYADSLPSALLSRINGALNIWLAQNHAEIKTSFVRPQVRDIVTASSGNSDDDDVLFEMDEDEIHYITGHIGVDYFYTNKSNPAQSNSNPEAQSEAPQGDGLTEVHENVDYGDAGKPLTGTEGADLFDGSNPFSDAGDGLNNRTGIDLLDGYSSAGSSASVPFSGGGSGNAPSTDILTAEDKAHIEHYVNNRAPYGYGMEESYNSDLADMLDILSVSDESDVPAVRQYYSDYWNANYPGSQSQPQPGSSGSGSSPAPTPGAGALTPGERQIIYQYADREHARGITDVKSAWHSAQSSIMADMRMKSSNIGEIKKEFCDYWHRSGYDSPLTSNPPNSGNSSSGAPNSASGNSSNETAPQNLTDQLLETAYSQGITDPDDLYNAVRNMVSERGADLRRRIAAFLAANAASASGNGAPPSLPNVSLDAYGYSADLDISQMNGAPILGELPSSDQKFEPSRIRSQAFAEWALSGRRYASNQYLTDLAQRMGVKVNSYHFDDVRRAMGIMPEITPEKQMYADAWYRAQDFLNMTQEERIVQRAGLDALGRTRSVGEIRARWWDALLPFSRFNTAKRDTEREYQDALAAEFDAKKDYLDAKARGETPDVLDQYQQRLADASNRRADIEYDRKRLSEGFVHWDSHFRKDERAVASAREVASELQKTYDPQTNTRLTHDAPTQELADLLRASNQDDVGKAFGQDRAERARFAAEEAAQLQRERDWQRREERRQSWGRKGEIAGSILGGLVGGSKGADIGGMLGKTIGSTLAGVATAFSLLKKTTDALERTWRRFRSWIEETVNQAFALAPFDSRLAAIKAWFQGQDFNRQVQRAQNLEESSAKVVEKWNELLDDTQDLRDAFIELKNVLKLVVLYFVDLLAKGAGRLTEWAKSITGEEKGAWAWGTIAEIVAGAVVTGIGVATYNPVAIGGGVALMGLGTAGIITNHVNDDEDVEPGAPPKRRKGDKVKFRSRADLFSPFDHSEESTALKETWLGMTSMFTGGIVSPFRPDVGGAMIIAGAALMGEANGRRAVYVDKTFDEQLTAGLKLANAAKAPLTQSEVEELALDYGLIRHEDDGSLTFKFPVGSFSSAKEKERAHTLFEYEAANSDNTVRLQGDLAREYYETGNIDETSLATYNKATGEAYSREEFKALLDREDRRDYFEDAIAFNDIERGANYYQGYRGLEGAPATERDLERVLEKIDNGNLALANANKHLAMLTDDVGEIKNKVAPPEKNPLVDNPWVKAMEMAADRNNKIEGQKFAKVEPGEPFGVKVIYGMSHRRAAESLYGELAAARERGVASNEQ